VRKRTASFLRQRTRRDARNWRSSWMPAAIIVSGRHLVGQPRVAEARCELLVSDRGGVAVRHSRDGARRAPQCGPRRASHGALPSRHLRVRRRAVFRWSTPAFVAPPGINRDIGSRPGRTAASRTGIRETYALREFATRVKEIVANAPAVYLPRASDSLYAPPGVAKPLTIEEQTSRAIADAFPGRSINDVTPLVKKLRLVKDQYEITALREAAAISCAVDDHLDAASEAGDERHSRRRAFSRRNGSGSAPRARRSRRSSAAGPRR